MLAVGFGFFFVFRCFGKLKMNSLANLPNKIFSFWKNCLLNPPNDNGNDAILYVGSLSITYTFLPSLDKKYAVAVPIIPPPIITTSSILNLKLVNLYLGLMHKLSKVNTESLDCSLVYLGVYIYS